MPIPVHLIDHELEKAILGKLIQDPKFSHFVMELAAEDFVLGAHKLIYSHVMRLAGKSKPISAMTVRAELADFGELEDVGGFSYVLDLNEHAIRAFDIEHCIGKLKDKTVMRNALTKAYEAVTLAESPGSTVEDLEAFSNVAQMADLRASRGIRLRTVQQIVSEHPGGINAFLRPVLSHQYVRFPWAKAQECIGGLWPGEVMVLGGRPGSGKSAAALQLARYNTQFGIVPAIFNLEMSDMQTIYRSICARTGISMAKFRVGDITEEQRMQLYHELTRLAGDNVLLCQQPSLTVAQIRSTLKKAVRDQGVNMLIVDYMQLADAGIKADNRAQEVSHVSRSIKLAAMECNVPAVVLAQLSRKSEDQHREPALSDLRESGSIEQDADVVMFTHRKQEPASAGGASSYKLLFKKVRNGPDGACGVHWDAKRLEFRDMEYERTEDY